MKFTVATCLLALGASVVSTPVTAQDVKVTLMDGSIQTGALNALTDSEVVLRRKPSYPVGTPPPPDVETTIPLTSVRTVERRLHGLRNGLLVGLGAGLVTGLLVGINVQSSESNSAHWMVLGGGVGGGIGAAIGAVHDATQRDRRLLYAAPSGALHVMPVITPQRQGVRLVLRW